MSDEEDYSSSDDEDYVPSGENFMVIFCVKYFTWHFVSYIGFICSFLHGITKRECSECVCVYERVWHLCCVGANKATRSSTVTWLDRIARWSWWYVQAPRVSVQIFFTLGATDLQVVQPNFFRPGALLVYNQFSSRTIFRQYSVTSF